MGCRIDVVSLGAKTRMKLSAGGGIEIYIAAERPEGVPARAAPCDVERLALG